MMMMQNIRIAFLTLSFFLLPLSFVAQNLYAFKIDSLINVRHPDIFNGVVLITKNGKTQYSRASGLKNIHGPAVLQPDDRFEIMSNTKQITAVLILKEVEKGKIELQDPIIKYLPDLALPWADSVTVHQLLNHTHGITDLGKPLLFRPGSDFKYGNISNVLLGKILTRVSGQSYRQAAESLFRQLGMQNTFCYSKENEKKPVTGHRVRNKMFTAVEESLIDEENLPADGIVTTAKDLSLWNGKLHKGKILSPALYRLMTTPSAMSQHDVFGKDKTGYGYNLRIIENQGIRYFGHTGLGDGFASLNIYVPESDVSIIVMENKMNENSHLSYYFETAIKNIVLQSSLVR